MGPHNVSLVLLYLCTGTGGSAQCEPGPNIFVYRHGWVSTMWAWFAEQVRRYKPALGQLLMVRFLQFFLEPKQCENANWNLSRLLQKGWNWCSDIVCWIKQRDVTLGFIYCTRAFLTHTLCAPFYTLFSFPPFVPQGPKREKSFLPPLLLMKAKLSVDGVEGRGRVWGSP